MVCSIGSDRFALEHTKLEAYAEQHRDGIHFEEALLELEHMAELPGSAWYMLLVPANCFQGLRQSQISKMRNLIAEWVREKSSNLKNFVRNMDVITAQIPDVPFPVTLQAIAGGPTESGGKLKIARIAPPGWEKGQAEQIAIALSKKIPKLEIWSNRGTSTVLILENGDPSLINHHWVLDKLREQIPRQFHCPDYIFFIYAIGTPWIVQTLIADGQFPDVSYQWWNYKLFESDDLLDLLAFGERNE